ncbi:MAG TPA: hypothetical protein VHS30_06245 [Streptosporangiaceae bacterium]|jgi:hypothetical protein|nr:hypothetical protein [Streptosporangiaceae bacterium]
MISSHLNSLNARERQREMIAQADRHRLARQLRDLTRASRLAGPSRSPRLVGLGAAALARLLPRYRTAR